MGKVNYILDATYMIKFAVDKFSNVYFVFLFDSIFIQFFHYSFPLCISLCVYLSFVGK